MWVLFALHLLGWLVLLDWVCLGGQFNSVYPEWVTVKFTTAMLMILSTFAVITDRFSRNMSEFVSLLVVTVSVSTLIIGPIQVGLDEGVKSASPGMPSLATLLGFVLIHIGLLIKNASVEIASAAWFLALAISVSAFLGYVLNMPVLYFHYEQSTAMAVLTATELFGISAVMVVDGVQLKLKKSGNGTNA